MKQPDVIFEPLQLSKNLVVKNRIFRSNVSGRFDNYDGSGSQTRINWELKFARGGVGAIISSFVPVTIRGRIAINYATIDRDDCIAFWKELGERVHEYDCRFIMQLSHSGRQRDLPGIEFPVGLSSTDRPDPLHGFPCERMTRQDIQETVKAFADGAERARLAGLDGVELHGANGYLITQFLSSAINDREDEYGGSLENRTRFLLEIVHAIRDRVGRDFHLQVKISATDHNDALFPLVREPSGNTVADSIQICQWLEQAGVDAIHCSTGSFFPHPRNPAGDLPMADLAKSYDIMASSGYKTLRNYKFFRGRLTGALFRWLWVHGRGPKVEGISLPDARLIRRAVTIPVICTGGFQTASVIRKALADGDCDAVSIARPLIANNDLVKLFERGMDFPPRPCTYCNRCAVHTLKDPTGCYEPVRFASHEEMLEQIMSVFHPSPFGPSSFGPSSLAQSPVGQSPSAPATTPSTAPSR